MAVHNSLRILGSLISFYEYTPNDTWYTQVLYLSPPVQVAQWVLMYEGVVGGVSILLLT